MRTLDRSFYGTEPGEVGLVERRLVAYGAVRGLVFGHWSEASEHVEALLSGCAHSGSLRHYAAMRAKDSGDAMGVLAWVLRRRWAMTAWRASARLLLDRLDYVGRGSLRAHARRENTDLLQNMMLKHEIINIMLDVLQKRGRLSLVFQENRANTPV